jgi:hypothetical protein
MQLLTSSADRTGACEDLTDRDKVHTYYLPWMVLRSGQFDLAGGAGLAQTLGCGAPKPEREGPRFCQRQHQHNGDQSPKDPVSELDDLFYLKTNLSSTPERTSPGEMAPQFLPNSNILDLNIKSLALRINFTSVN